MPSADGGEAVEFLTVAEVAETMRVSKMTVYRLVHAGELPAVRVGKSFRVPREVLETYLRTAFMGDPTWADRERHSGSA